MSFVFPVPNHSGGSQGYRLECNRDEQAGSSQFVSDDPKFSNGKRPSLRAQGLVDVGLRVRSSPVTMATSARVG